MSRATGIRHMLLFNFLACKTQLDEFPLVAANIPAVRWPKQRNPITRVVAVSCTFLAAVILVGCGSGTSAENRTSLSILAAASTTEGMQDIIQAFEKEHPDVKINLSLGPTNALAQQITAGAPADIFLSANKKWVQTIKEAGRYQQSVDLLTNRMVLIVPQDNPAEINSVEDIDSDKVGKLALAGDTVPAGIYAEQALRKLNVFDQLLAQRKLARGSDVRITLSYVELGEAEVGIVYATDARLSNKIRVISELEPNLYDPIVYPLVRLKIDDDRGTAVDQFYEFLQSTTAQRIFSEYKFTPLIK